MTSFVRRWAEETGDTYVASLVRALLGALLTYGAAREVLLLASRDFHFADVFHLPLVPEAWVPGRALHLGFALTQLLLALLVVAGRLARPALFATSILGVYLLACDRLAYHNNRYALFLFALLFALAPCDRAFVFPKRTLTDEERQGPLWAVRLARLQMSIIYLASGGSKLVDPDWRDGLVLGDRLARATSMAVAKGVPRWLMDMLADPAFSSGLAKLAIATELVLAVALFLPRTRAFALWWGTMFHLAIEVTSQVEIFTWLSLTVYALFAVPRLAERTLLYDASSPRARTVARIVRGADWLARFQVRADVATKGIAVVGRDGSRGGGLMGYARIARAIPVFFPLAFPLWLAARVFAPRHGDARADAW
jgi:hypothetical protein